VGEVEISTEGRLGEDQFASISEEVSTTHARIDRTMATIARNAAINIAAHTGGRR
jgi:hypothetical protein